MGSHSRSRDETLEEILHKVIHHDPQFSLAQLAEELGVQEHVLYEWANPNQKRQFPLSRLLPLMRITKNTRMVERLAAQVGLVVFRLRKKGKGKLENAEDLLGYLQTFSELLKVLIEAFKSGGRLDKKTTLQEIDKFMATLAGLRQDVENMNDQIELGLEE